MKTMCWGVITIISILVLSIFTMVSADTLTIQYNDGTTQSVPLDRPSSSLKRLDFSGDLTSSRPILNLARGKQARQSSIYSGDAGRAVDGNTDGNYYANSIIHTGSQPQEWWEVDLGAIIRVRLIFEQI
jgi:hypothetical protein